MANKYIPSSTKRFIQNNRSDTYPLVNIWSTFNIDFTSNLGTIRVSPRMRLVSSTADDANLGVPVAFRYFSSKIWAICGSRMFTNSGETDDTFSLDATSSVPTNFDADESDLEIFNGTLCATATNGLWSCDGSAWTSRDSLNTGNAHVMTYFKKFDRLYYSNLSDNILSINNAWVTADPGADYAISLSTDSNQYTITSIKATSDAIWIGVVNRSNKGSGGKVLQWDGISQSITREYPLSNTQGCMALAIDPVTDTPVAMGSDGILYGFNGSGFQEIGRLPFDQNTPYNIDDTDNERFIHPNGMFFTSNNTLLALVNNRRNNSSQSVIENMPSGIWEWNRDVGLTHRQSVSYNPVSSETITDFGQNRVARVGALASMRIPSTNANMDGTMLAGVTYYTNASSSSSGIFTDNSLDTIRKSGYFVTGWMDSDEIEDTWNKIWAKYRRLLNDSDRIVVKYRLEEEAPTSTDITWVNTTSFTTTTNISAYAPESGQTYGGEVEILRGTGGGTCRHITNVSENAGTYTVTIDTAVTGVTTGTASARFQKWVKTIPSPDTTSHEIEKSVNGYTGLPVGVNSPRIEVKVYMEWTGKNEFRRLGIYSNDHLDQQD